MAMLSCLAYSKPVVPSAVITNAVGAIISPRTLYSTTHQYPFNKRQRFKCFSHAEIKVSQSDNLVIQVIESEIKSKQSSLKQSMPLPPADFPFRIHDNPCERRLILRRELGGEDIYVSVAMPDFIHDDEDEGKCPCWNWIPVDLYVRITKGNGKKLGFGVSLSAREMSVEIISVMEPVESESNEHRLVCFGPHNLEEMDSDILNSDIKCGLREYLEIRGIRKSDALFLYEYMVKKYKQQSLHVLEKFKKFVDK